MKTLQFEGYSDDNFGENAVFGDTFDNCASGEPIVFLVQAGDERLFVYGHYSPINQNACWAVGVTKVEEEDVIPAWPVRIKQGDRAYSIMLEIDAPDGVSVRCITLEETKKERGDD